MADFINKMTNKYDITSVRSVTYAAVFTFLALIFTTLAFSTPYWLEARPPVIRFERLGLWEACFKSFRDTNYLYDNEFRGCKWLFNEDYAFLLDFLEPAFFITVQVLYTIGFVFMMVSCIGVLAIQLCFIIDREIFAMKVLSLSMFLSAFFSTIAVIIFGIRGDDRDWMPDHEHNFLSWSFGLAVVGVFFTWMSAILFWVESRVLYKKELKRQQEMFHLEPTGIKA